MKTTPLASLAGLLLGFAVSAQESPASPEPVRFHAVELYLHSQDKPLAAYQLEFKAVKGEVRIVGIEGGEHPEFNEPPFHDPEAMQQERVIIGAFSTAPTDQLPVGNTRVATVHLQSTGKQLPRYEVRATAAATANGRKISVEASAKEKPRNEDQESLGED